MSVAHYGYLVLSALALILSFEESVQEPVLCIDGETKHCNICYPTSNTLVPPNSAKLLRRRFCRTNPSKMAPVCPNTTVAFAFIIKDKLPLWTIWKRYLRDCPIGSYTIVMHRQAEKDTKEHPRRPLDHNITAHMCAVGGRIVPPACTLVRGMPVAVQIIISLTWK